MNPNNLEVTAKSVILYTHTPGESLVYASKYEVEEIITDPATASEWTIKFYNPKMDSAKDLTRDDDLYIRWIAQGITVLPFSQAKYADGIIIERLALGYSFDRAYGNLETRGDAELCSSGKILPIHVSFNVDVNAQFNSRSLRSELNDGPLDSFSLQDGKLKLPVVEKVRPTFRLTRFELAMLAARGLK